MKRKRLMKGLALALALLVLGSLVLGAAGYAMLFAGRVETPAGRRYALSDFPGLEAEAVAFSNNRGEPLAGWLYRYGDAAPAGLVVMVHGMGNGHLAYLNVAAAFARAGWLVFAYDATGNDASGGSERRGIPQAVLDLDAALTAAEALPQTRGLPVCLFGHSLGAYTVCAALADHPEIRAAAALSGFDGTAAYIREVYGVPGLILLPGALLWERLRFGGAAGRTALEGFAASEARVLIVHGTADPVVPISSGLDRYEAVYGNDPRFTFLRINGADHGGVFTRQVREACLELFREACQ